MAAPLSFHPNARDARIDAAERLRNAPLEQADALLSACAVLQGLHDEGLLEIIRGGLGARDKILQIVVNAANTPGAIQGIRNLVILAKLVGTLDPKILEGVAQAIPEGLATASTDKPIGIWSMLRRLCSGETWCALAAGACVLQSVGKALKLAHAR
jgi:uncharacterized protein YjgD (DUF1641 family)